MGILLALGSFMLVICFFCLIFMIFGDTSTRKDFIRSGDGASVLMWIVIAAVLLLIRSFF